LAALSTLHEDLVRVVLVGRDLAEVLGEITPIARRPAGPGRRRAAVRARPVARTGTRLRSIADDLVRTGTLPGSR
jgi:hypothetical protein